MAVDFEKKYPKEYHKAFLKGEKLYEDGKTFSLKHAKDKSHKNVSQLCAAEVGLHRGYEHAESQDHKTKEYGEDIIA